MDSGRTTARVQFQEILQSRMVRETVGAEINSGPNCVFCLGFKLSFQEASKQNFM